MENWELARSGTAPNSTIGNLSLRDAPSLSHRPVTRAVAGDLSDFNADLRALRTQKIPSSTRNHLPTKEKVLSVKEVQEYDLEVEKTTPRPPSAAPKHNSSTPLDDWGLASSDTTRKTRVTSALDRRAASTNSGIPTSSGSRVKSASRPLPSSAYTARPPSQPHTQTGRRINPNSASSSSKVSSSTNHNLNATNTPVNSSTAANNVTSVYTQNVPNIVLNNRVSKMTPRPSSSAAGREPRPSTINQLDGVRLAYGAHFSGGGNGKSPLSSPSKRQQSSSRPSSSNGDGTSSGNSSARRTSKSSTTTSNSERNTPRLSSSNNAPQMTSMHLDLQAAANALAHFEQTTFNNDNSDFIVDLSAEEVELDRVGISEKPRRNRSSKGSNEEGNVVENSESVTGATSLVRPQSRKLYLGSEKSKTHLGSPLSSSTPPSQRTPKSAGARLTHPHVDNSTPNVLDSEAISTPLKSLSPERSLRRLVSHGDLHVPWDADAVSPITRPPSRQSSAFPVHLADDSRTASNSTSATTNATTGAPSSGTALRQSAKKRANGSSPSIPPKSDDKIDIGSPFMTRPPSRQKIAAQHLFEDSPSPPQTATLTPQSNVERQNCPTLDSSNKNMTSSSPGVTSLRKKMSSSPVTTGVSPTVTPSKLTDPSYSSPYIPSSHIKIMGKSGVASPPPMTAVNSLSLNTLNISNSTHSTVTPQRSARRGAGDVEGASRSPWYDPHADGFLAMDVLSDVPVTIAMASNRTGSARGGSGTTRRIISETSVSALVANSQSTTPPPRPFTSAAKPINMTSISDDYDSPLRSQSAGTILNANAHTSSQSSITAMELPPASFVPHYGRASSAWHDVTGANNPRPTYSRAQNTLGLESDSQWTSPSMVCSRDELDNIASDYYSSDDCESDDNLTVYTEDSGTCLENSISVQSFPIESSLGEDFLSLFAPAGR